VLGSSTFLSGGRLAPAAYGRSPLAKTIESAEIVPELVKSSPLSVVEEDGTMQTRNRGDYTIAGCELVAEGADLRVQVLTLAAGQCVPWHYHTEISDRFICLEGPMVVETRAPRHVYRLLPGERCAVPPKTAHYVHGEADGACRFLIVQGVGVYDFVAVGG
jgi:quercetin dioxygenase-like cupin family protein